MFKGGIIKAAALYQPEELKKAFEGVTAIPQSYEFKPFIEDSIMNELEAWKEESKRLKEEIPKENSSMIDFYNKGRLYDLNERIGRLERLINL